QAPLESQAGQPGNPQLYCQDLVNIQTPFLAANRQLLASGQSPVTAQGNNLLTFMADELDTSFANLGCQHYGLTDPVTITRNSTGAAVAATFTTARQKASGWARAPPRTWKPAGPRSPARPPSRAPGGASPSGSRSSRRRSSSRRGR